MKTSKETSFAPVKLIITLESDTEYKLFHDMMGFNVSVPEITCRGDYKTDEHKHQLRDMMSSIRNAMSK